MMIADKFKYAGAVALGLAFVPAETLLAHVPDHGHGHDLMMPYHDFIMNMQDKNGTNCCSFDDAIADIPETPKTDGRYIVTIPANTIGFAWDLEVEIPADRVLTAEHARAVCETMPWSTTCNMPPFNVLWGDPLSMFHGDSVFCYWPAPKLGMKGDKDAVEHAGRIEPHAFSTRVSFESGTAPLSVPPARWPVHPHP